MSFVQWLTRSWPIVSCRPASIATLIFVPTPSALATRRGRLASGGTRNIPPKPPKPPREPPELAHARRDVVGAHLEQPLDGEALDGERPHGGAVDHRAAEVRLTEVPR